jgi:phosphohistidine swiveling domain-containing protein
LGEKKMTAEQVAGTGRVAEVARGDGIWLVDNPPSPKYPIYTRANIGEVFPDVVMPFSWTIWGIPHAEPGWCKALVQLGAFDSEEFTEGEMEMLGVFGGYGYLNVSASRIFGVRTPGLSPQAIDLSFFGEQPDVPPYEPRAADESPRHSAQMGATLAWVFAAENLPDLQQTRKALDALRSARPALEALSSHELLQHVRALCTTHWEGLWIRHIVATYHSMIPSGVLAATAVGLQRPELIADLLAAVGGVDSALPAERLWALGRQVAAAPQLMARFDEGLEHLPERIATDKTTPVSEFNASFATFLADFGFRGPKEWEMRSRCWELDPKTPLAAIDRMRHADPDESPAARNARRRLARDSAVNEVRGMLAGAPEQLAQFDAALRACAVFFAGRERTKTHCAMLTHEMRMAMWTLGQRFVAQGWLDSADHFALLTNAEWDRVLQAPADARAIVAERLALEQRLTALQPPFIVAGEVPPLERWKSRTTTPQQARPGSVLTGQPGCAGIFRGRVRVVHDPGEPGDFEPGDVLVARHTDPSWTPLFSAAGAVVVNVGATISHAVIVARELGVPCVVSVTGATEKLMDGIWVEVDGAAGTVRLLASAEMA